jgi:hypothetical protein
MDSKLDCLTYIFNVARNVTGIIMVGATGFEAQRAVGGFIPSVGFNIGLLYPATSNFALGIETGITY